MSNVNQVRKKLAMLRKSPAKELLYDIHKLYLETVHENPPSVDIEALEHRIQTLESMYLSQIPKKQKKVVHKDLLDSIEECKADKLKQVVKVLQVVDTEKDDHVVDNMSKYITE